MNSKSSIAAVKKTFTIAEWLPHYKLRWLRFDIIAALSVWALLVPQGIAYSSIAGVPAQYGLYAALGSLIGYALFGTSGQVVTGPSAAIAAVSASVVTLWASAGSSEWIAYTATLGVSAGVIYVVLGVLKMGWISHFLSGAVLGGFVFGFGFGLIVDQMPKILGISKADGSYFDVLVGVVTDIGDTSMPTLAVGAVSILLLLAFRRFLPRLPRTIVIVIVGIVLSDLLNFENHGVAIVGEIPDGLPTFLGPDLPPVPLSEVVLGSLAIIFIGYSESLAAAKEEGKKYDYEIDASQEMVGQGMANVGSGLLGGYAVGGSLSKTTVADTAGQKTQLASLITAGLLLLTILLLTGFFTTLPQAVLGAVVIDAGISLIKFREFRFYRLSDRDFAAFVATALAVFFIGVLAGVVAGVTLALLLLIVSSSRTPTRQMAFARADNAYVRVDHYPEAELVPGILVVAICGPLFFADADSFRSSVSRLVKATQPHSVVVDFTAVVTMDVDGMAALLQLAGDLRGRNIRVFLVNVGKNHLELMRRTSALDQFGADAIHRTVRQAVACAQTAAKKSGEDSQPS
ncbi:SulP family inorganic anion transporter [Aldersonia kunmingensis]|uniref:SulP family inorganic anion transporter n=1 Tax=Aldersonia kunmingensis TaxID=408066 RepID=UPI0008330CE8|nr:SulP family inorganic anion transporter [Aldersonia kunmingensis]